MCEVRCGGFVAKIVEGTSTAEVYFIGNKHLLTGETCAGLAVFFTRISTLLGTHSVPVKSLKQRVAEYQPGGLRYGEGPGLMSGMGDDGSRGGDGPPTRSR